MRIIYLTLSVVCCMLLSMSSYAQRTGCSSGRYVTRNYFTTITTDTGVVYGSNDSATGSGTQTLKLDVYQPAGDTVSKRPVIIMAFGGSFIGGKRQDVRSICQDLAKMGYIAVAPDYRYAFSAVFPPNERNVTLEVLRASQDLKAVVRFLNKDFSTSNTYRVDTSAIIMGGISAGAIAGIHAAYLKTNTPLPSYLTTSDTTGFGGVNGNSGNPGYSSHVSGVISYSGTIGDTMWIQSGDQPIFMVHDTTDPTVPFGTAEVNISGIPTGLIASGDGAMDAYMNRIGGVTHAIRTYNNGWHVDYLSQDYDSVLAVTTRFVSTNDNVCTARTTGISNIDAGVQVSIFPNPATNHVTILTSTDQLYNITLVNAVGQTVMVKEHVSGQIYDMETSALAPGFYVVKLTSAANNTSLATQKLIIK